MRTHVLAVTLLLLLVGSSSCFTTKGLGDLFEPKETESNFFAGDRRALIHPKIQHPRYTVVRSMTEQEFTAAQAPRCPNQGQTHPLLRVGLQQVWWAAQSQGYSDVNSRAVEVRSFSFLDVQKDSFETRSDVWRTYSSIPVEYAWAATFTSLFFLKTATNQNGDRYSFFYAPASEDRWPEISESDELAQIWVDPPSQGESPNLSDLDNFVQSKRARASFDQGTYQMPDGRKISAYRVRKISPSQIETEEMRFLWANQTIYSPEIANFRDAECRDEMIAAYSLGYVETRDGISRDTVPEERELLMDFDSTENELSKAE